MSQIIHILKYKILGYINFSFSGNFSDFVKNFGSSLVYFSFAAGAFFFARSVMFFLLEQMQLGLFLLHEFLSIVFFIFFMAINVGNVIVSWSTLYKSTESAYLFTKPVDPQNIFIIKFFDNLFYSSSTLLLILFSLFLGYASYFDVNFFILLSILTFNLFPFIITAASLGVIILLLIVKLASKFGVGRVLGVLIGLYLISVFFFFKISSPMDLIYQVMAAYPNVDQYFGYLIPPVLKYLPNKWFAESLYWIARDEFLRAIPFMLMQILSSSFMLLLAVILGGKWYYKSWRLNMKFSMNSNFLKGRAIKNTYIQILDWGTQLSAIIKKDLIVFFRDPSQVLHLGVLLILMLIFMSSVSGISFTNFDDPQLTALVYIIIFLFNILLIATISLRFVFPIISLEGLTFWKIRTSPVNRIKMLNIKLTPSLIFILLLSQLLIFFSNLKLAPHLIFYSLFLFIPITFSIVMMNFGMGIIFVKYKEPNPIRIASSQGASLTFLFCLIYMTVLVGILIYPITYHFNLLFYSYYYHYWYLEMAAFAITIISLITGTAFYLLGIKSIKNDF